MYSEEYHCPRCQAPVDWRIACDPAANGEDIIAITFFCGNNACEWYCYCTLIDGATVPAGPLWLDSALAEFAEV